MLARKDVLSDGGRCRTASNSTFARCHLSGVISMALFQLSIQPGFGTRPFPPNGCRGNTQNLRCFFNRESTEVPELNDSALPSIKLYVGVLHELSWLQGGIRSLTAQMAYCQPMELLVDHRNEFGAGFLITICQLFQQRRYIWRDGLHSAPPALKVDPRRSERHSTPVPDC